MGEHLNAGPNSIGTGLRSYQLVGRGAPYGPINLQAGQPEKGFYSVPANGGCSSCQKGITVTQNQMQMAPSVNYAAQVPAQTYVQQTPQTYAPAASVPAHVQTPMGGYASAPAYAQSVPQVQTYAPVQTYAQPQVQTYAPVQTYAQPQTQPYSQPVQQVQYQEAVKPAQPAQRFSGSLHYRANYAPSKEVPGYIRAQQNAEKEGIGFDDVPARTQKNSAFVGRTVSPEKDVQFQSGWQSVSKSGSASGIQIVPASSHTSVRMIPVDSTSTQALPAAPAPAQMETIPTPAPRAESSVLSGTPGMAVYPQAAAPIYPMDAGCGDVCAAPCDPCVPCDPCGPCVDPCVPCGPCVDPCGPWGCGPWGGIGCGPYGGCWPGVIPLAADTVRLAGRVVFRTGRAAVIGTGMAACGVVRTAGFVLWNRPLPAPCWGGPCFGGPCFGGVGPAPAMMDPVYAENDFYLNASAGSPNAGNVQIAGTVTPNLYEPSLYPQNYLASTSFMPAGTVPAAASAPVVPMNAPAVNYTSGNAPLLAGQTQRMYLEDGTEVIIEQDASFPENGVMNASVQYASANGSAVPALHSAVSSAPAAAIQANVSAQTIPVSVSTAASSGLSGASGVVLKPASVSSAVPVQTQAVPLENVPAAAAPQTAAENYPIIMAETPQIQLAPGEVLISQEDFILEPIQTESEATPQNSVNESANENGKFEFIQGTGPTEETLEKVPEPVRDANVTKVSYLEPIPQKKTEDTDTENSKPGKIISTTVTPSGWQVISRE